jgi:hypothetical protein
LNLILKITHNIPKIIHYSKGKNYGFQKKPNQNKPNARIRGRKSGVDAVYIVCRQV